MPHHHERGHLLYQQGRYRQAADEFRAALAGDPNDAEAHAFLAECLSELSDPDGALREAEEAVRLAPLHFMTHTVKASVLHRLDRYEEAEASALEAISNNIDSTWPFSVLANIRFSRGNWLGCLEATGRALTLDPNNPVCLSLQTMANLRLGRKADAAFSAETALRNDPNDPFAHVAEGWRRMHAGDAKGACEHFRTALRLDPTSTAARVGMIEALKARYWVYRQYSLFQLWLSRQSSQFQWFVILGLFFLMRLLSATAHRQPALKVVITPVMIVLVAFGLMTWMGSGLFNLLLLFHPLGRQALNRAEKREGFWLGGFLLLGLAGVGVAEFVPPLVEGPPTGPLSAAMRGVGVMFAGLATMIAALASVFAVAGWYRLATGWPKRVATAALAVAWVLWAVVLALIAVLLGCETPDEALAALAALKRGSEFHLWYSFGVAVGMNVLMASHPDRG